MIKIIAKKELAKDCLGFTLVELLVVISIVAILGTIAMTVFSGAQGSARDGKRRSEIGSLGKAIESAKDYASGVYTYDSLTLDKDFPRGIGNDKSYAYCIKTDTASNSPVPPSSPYTGWDATNCPTNSGYLPITALSFPDFGADTKSWTLCAKLERSSEAYCKSSLTARTVAEDLFEPTVPAPIPTAPIPTPTVLAPTPTPTLGAFKYVFVTSQTYSGNLGGLSGADSKCQTLAQAANLPGTYKAWLSDSTTSAASRLTHADVPYKLVNGTVVASNWTSLVNGISAPINVTEINTSAPPISYAWSNTTPQGNIGGSWSGDHCTDWTIDTRSAAYSGRYGNNNMIWSGYWTQILDYKTGCYSFFTLYCFQQ